MWNTYCNKCLLHTSNPNSFVILSRENSNKIFIAYPGSCGSHTLSVLKRLTIVESWPMYRNALRSLGFVDPFAMLCQSANNFFRNTPVISVASIIVNDISWVNGAKLYRYRWGQRLLKRKCWQCVDIMCKFWCKLDQTF